MIEHIYIEKPLIDHPRVARILRRYPNATITECEQYGEIFNRKAQNFRLQKIKPALILASKFKRFILPAPPAYAIGGDENYYFSHMLNCLYDCRYCFLQGMYRSAHYVVFINYEDFIAAIIEKITQRKNHSIHFFSGYDCDSLALEPVTHFLRECLPVFGRYPNALLELRTKSTQIRSLLSIEPIKNAVIAYTLTPDEVARKIEHKAPSVLKRLHALKQLQSQGWQIGLRFDPLIYHEDAVEQYAMLFKQIFRQIDPGRLHSVSLGSFRLPKSFYQTMVRLYPEETLFAAMLHETKDGMITYKKSKRDELLSFCKRALLAYIPEEKLFPCEAIPD